MTDESQGIRGLERESITFLELLLNPFEVTTRPLFDDPRSYFDLWAQRSRPAEVIMANPDPPHTSCIGGKRAGKCRTCAGAPGGR